MDFKHTSIKQSALGWVKKSIDDSLATIRSDLNVYIEEKDSKILLDVRSKLADVQGVLTMIEQYGAAMLTEEMNSLCEFIASKDEQDEQALEVLLRAVLQLPDYLEHIQAGQKDIPIAILPLLNDIRAVKNEDLFSEKLLFLPDLSMHMDDSEIDSIDEGRNQASMHLARKLRPAYQFSLLGVIRDKDVHDNLKRLSKITEVLEDRSASEQVARLWWIVGALVESIARDDLPLGVSVKMLMGKVDQVFRRLMVKGEKELLREQPIDLIKNLLYYIAQPECDGPKSQAIKTAYRLEQFLPSDKDQGSSIAGPNQELLKTVSDAVQADLEEVKSSLEVYVNGDLAQTEQLKNLPAELHIISDTLAMIGLGSQRQVIEAQIEVINDVIEGRIQPDQEKMLAMAAELIQVDQALELMEKGQLPQQGEEGSSSKASLNFEMGNMLNAVVTAALDNIQKIKISVLDFIKDPAKRENIETCKSLLQETRGALALLNQERAVDVIDGLVQYLGGNEIEDFLDAGHLDQMSQVVVSVEYYLEALGEQRTDAETILDFADEQLDQLLAGKDIDVSVSGETESETQDLVISAESEQSAGDEGELPIEVAEIDSGELPDSPSFEAETDAVQFEIPEASELNDDNAGDDSPFTPEAIVEDSATALSESDAGMAFEADEEFAPGSFTAIDSDDLSAEPVHETLAEEGIDALPDAVLDVAEAGPTALDVGIQEIEFEDVQAFAVEHDLDGPDAGAGTFGEVQSDETEQRDGLGDKDFVDDQVVDAVGTQPEATEQSGDDEEAVDLYAFDGTSSGHDRNMDAAMPDESPEDDESDHTVYTLDEGAEDHEAFVSGGTDVEPVEDDAVVLKPGGDAEILEIYLEEADEESEQIRQQQQDWKLHPEDENALKNIRRSFHTIKGSGRLVGAMKIGEFAWDFENLLNRVIDKTVEPSSQVIEAVGMSAEALPQLIEELKNGTRPVADIAYLRGLARALIEGKQVNLAKDRMSSPVDGHREQESSAASVPEDDATEEGETSGDSASLVQSESDEALLVDVPGDADHEAHAPDDNDSDPLTQDTAPEFSPEGREDAEIDFNDFVLSMDEQAPSAPDDKAPKSADTTKDGLTEGAPHDPFDLSAMAPMPGGEAGQNLPGDPSPAALAALEMEEENDLQLDPELLVIYQQEVESHLNTVNSALESSADAHELVPSEALYRAIHTINGASRTADITSIGILASLLEAPLKKILEQGVALDEEVLELYRRGHDEIKRMTSELVLQRRMPVLPEDLRRDLESLVEEMDNHTVELPEQNKQPSNQFLDTLTMMNEEPGPDYDDELVEIFIEEATDLLEMSDHTLEAWVEQGEDADDGKQGFGLVTELQRYLHTLKGGAKMAEFDQISNLSHELESLFIAIIDRRVEKNDDLIGILHDSFDLLTRQVEQVKNRQIMASSDEQIEVIKRLRKGEPVAAAHVHDEDEEPESDALQPEGAEAAQSDAVIDDRRHDELHHRRQSDAVVDDGRSSERDVVKVRSDLLDNLVNSAGEVSIYRARMEQQVSSFGSHLGELGQTIQRLKNQLRTLEAETDAQIPPPG